LVRVFEGNFKGTYIRPGNSWDLSKCKQKSGETLREYARRFSKQRTELPHIPDHDVILDFVSGTTSKDLVWELGRNRPQTVDELMDVVANYAAGEEAVDAFFSYEGGKGKSPTDDDEGPSRGPKKNKKKKKARLFQQEALDDDLVTAMERKRPRGPPEGAIFDEMLKEPCPYHKGGANHKLKDCRMLKKHFDGLGFMKDDQKKEKNGDKGDDKDDEGFPAVQCCYMIYGGPSTQITARQHKRERREVFAARMAVPQYLNWSNTPITFDRDDHPDKVIAPGVYPLVVDPIIVNTRLSKVLMDGGSNLNIIYLETLDLLGINQAQLQPSAGGFHGVVPGKKALPVGQIDLPVCFGTMANFRKETLTFEVVGFRGTYHAIIGRSGYAKFMAIPNYTYLKLKMPGPKGVITVSSSYEHTYECDVECVEYGEAIESSAELASKLEALAVEAPEPKRHAGSFEPAEGTKKIPLDPNNSDSKVLTISADLDPK